MVAFVREPWYNVLANIGEKLMERHTSHPAYIYSAGYDTNINTFEVELHSGAVYQYYNLPQNVYDEFKKARSKTLFAHFTVFKYRD